MTAPDRGSQWTQRLSWRNWSVPVKLIAVLLVPTVFALTLGVLRILDQTNRASSFDGIQQTVTLEDRTASLLAMVEHERDVAAVFLASGRVGDIAGLHSGFAAVDTAITATTTAAGDLSKLDRTAGTAFRAATDQLGKLARLRQQVEVGDVDAPTAVRDYTAVTDALLGFDQSLTRQAADPNVAGLTAALKALAVTREQVALQHAVIGVAIARGRMDSGDVDAVRFADVRRDGAVAEFRAAVSPELQQLYTSTASGADAATRDQLKAVAVNRGAAGLPLLISALEWDRLSTAATDALGKVAQTVREQLAGAVFTLRESASNAAGVASVVLLLALLAGAVVVILVARSLLRPLRMLRRTALDVAERRLPRAVQGIRAGAAPPAIEPVPVTTSEEIGQVARAFDAVHGQAIRLAAEQADLRAAFNSIFVNLSRRSQALVERQLQLIEQLEAAEQNPDALANLFQLDHLATRMRRNSENLLVLSGTELGRRSTRPVPLVDVLRAAVSEVEQYHRVLLQPPPTLQVLGNTASDLVHLVAELLENATSFSAPDTEVSIISRLGVDGRLAVEVSDQGVGMSEADLAEANARLAAPPMIDVLASRRMGLFVVGRLAGRHEIEVRLVGAGSGVTAVVTVPAATVVADAGASRGAAATARSMAAGLPVRIPSSASSNGNGATARDALSGTAGLGGRSASSLPQRPTGPAAGEGAAGGASGRSDAGVTGDALFADQSAVDADADADLVPAEAPEPAEAAEPAGQSEPSVPPPSPTEVTASIPVVTSGSAADLFSPVVAPEAGLSSIAGLSITRRAVPESLPFGRPPLEEATPIFDEIASAWFREQKPVPVNWSGERSGSVEPATGESGSALPRHERGDGTPVDADPVTRRPRPQHATAEAEQQSAVDFSSVADAGWQAARAVEHPELNGTTVAGLPQRRPRAQLVPGAAGPSRAAPHSSTARNPELVRGWLASYQQGVLEGRHQCHSQVQDVDGDALPDVPADRRADEEST